MRSVRFQGDTGKAKLPVSTGTVYREKPSRSLKQKVLSRVFSEDYGSNRAPRKVLDPRGPTIQRWNKLFLAACLVSLFVEPLLFFLPGTTDAACIDIAVRLEVALTVIRSLADVFYVVQIFVRFRTAYISPSSRVFGRGELVIDPAKISARYLSRGFWLDLFTALPLPQFLLWVVIPNLKGSIIANTKNVLRFSIILQYVPRLCLIVPLSSQIVKATGVLTETAWAGAAYNLILYMLASHVLGALWYLLSVERQESCWRAACALESPICDLSFLDCRHLGEKRQSWFRSSNLTRLCEPSSSFYEFGIYADALNSGVTSLPFLQKYFFCFWWGLQNLSSLGQNLMTSTYVGEIGFAIVMAVLGLVLFGLLIGNMQSYLQSTSAHLEEWRTKRTDTEQWMRHRQLPHELRMRVRKYDQCKWMATRGVNEESLIDGLPRDLRRDIKRHLCLDLVRRVPLFDQMDEQMLDAICERLRPALYTEGTCPVRELDPVSEMLFIIRGHLDSYTTNGGRTGFFNSCRIGPGDFCGEELLTWALDPRPAASLPSSTRTVKTIFEVEAFALVAEDLRFVAAQFRRLHSKQLRHKFRFYSLQWRAWAACFIQAAWRRSRRRRASLSIDLRREDLALVAAPPGRYPKFQDPLQQSRAAAAARLLPARSRAGPREPNPRAANSSLMKPAEPDFSVEEP
ncbi:cyclic nucleotide-gated channel 15 [Wolffia australiana]